MLGAGSILAGAFIGAGIGALSTTAMKEGEEISTGNVRSAGERLAYAVFDDSMSWDEKWAYAFEPGQMVADFVTGVVIGEILDGIMAATQNKLRSIFANYDATMREAIESGTDTTRVGRWMSQDEYDKMVASGKVQMSGDNKVHVANPADINAFGKQAPKGSVYVEFDVPSNTISKGGTDGWGIINGPGSLLDRLNAKKGLPRITEMPNVTNISIEGSK